MTGVTVSIIDETFFHVLNWCVTTAARMGHMECSYVFPEITPTFSALSTFKLMKCLKY